MKMKKVFLTLLIAILIISPTIVLTCVYFYYQSDSHEFVSTEVESGIIIENDGTEHKYTKDDPRLQIYIAMHGTGKDDAPKALTALPEEALSYVKYEILYTDTFDVESTYTYYLSDNPDKCYYVDGDNKAYRVHKSSAVEFLNSNFSEKVYPSAVPPSVTLAGKPLIPYTVDWQYKTVGGVLKTSSASYSDKNEKNEFESFSTALRLIYSMEPDEVTITVQNKENGKELFKGDPKKLEDLEINGSILVTVDMQAVWKNGNEKANTGSMKFFFSGRLLGTPAFKISTNSAVCGDVVIISANNVVDPSEIQILMEPMMEYKPVFYKVGEGWQALLPIPATLVKETTAFTFTIKTESATDILFLTVAPLENRGTLNYYLETPYTEDAVTEFMEFTKTIYAGSSDFAFKGGKFVLPTSDFYKDSPTNHYRFGTTVKFGNHSFFAYDRMYCAVGGKAENGVYGEGTKTKALAAFDGKVVYVGEQTITGRMVIIDHGSGLRTWYTNLSSDIQVKVGDEVLSGQMLSHVADGGYNTAMNFNFHVGATVGNVPVDIERLIQNGLIAQ